MEDTEINKEEEEEQVVIEKPGLVDKVLAKIVSRKLFVFVTATCLMLWSTLDSETWGLIATFYIGGQSVIDAVSAYKAGM